MKTQRGIHERPIYQTWMTIVYDQNLEVVEIINPQHCMLLQMDEESLLGHNVDDLPNITDKTNRDSAMIIAKNLHKAQNENRNVYFEYTTTHKDKTMTYAVCYAEKGNDGLLYVNVIKIDEENIFEAREGFTNYVIDVTINNISVGVYMRHIDPDKSKAYLLFNDVAKEFFECDDVVKSKYWNQQEEDLADQKAMELRDPLKIEKVIRDKKDNILRWLVFTKKKINSRASGYYIITTIIDITQRRQNEILLEQQFALLDSMYKHLPLGIIIYDKTGRLVSMNQKNMNIFGLKDKSELLGLNLFEEPNLPAQIADGLHRGEDAECELEYDFALATQGYIQTDLVGKKTLQIKFTVIKDREGNIDGYLLINEDITVKKQVQEQAEQKHRLLEAIYETAPTGIEVYDKDGVLIEMNNYEMQLMGITDKASIEGLKLFENPNLSEEFYDKLRAGKDFEYIVEYDFQKVHQNAYYASKAGGFRLFDVKASVIRNEKGEIISYLLVNHDRTEMILQERKLRDTQENLQLALEASRIETWTYDVIRQRFHSLKDDRRINLESLKQFTHPDDLDSIHASFRDIIEGRVERATIIYRDTLSSPEYRYYRTMMVGKREAGKVVSITGTKKDITEEYIARKQLEENAKRTELIAKACNIFQWEYDLKKKQIIKYSEGTTTMGLALNFEEYIQFVHPDDVEQMRALFSRFDNETLDIVKFQYRLRSPDGSYRYIAIDGVPMHDQEGRVNKYIGFSRDRSDWVEINEQLVAQNKKTEYSLSLLNNILDKIPLGLFVKDLDNESRYVIINDNLMQLRGAKSPIIGKSDYETLPKEVADDYYAENEAAIEAGGKPIVSLHHETSNGQNVWLEKTQAIFSTADGRHMLVGVVADVSTREQARIQLHKTTESITETNLVLNNILQQIPVGFFIKDIDDGNRYIMANQQLANIHQCHISDFLGHTVENIIDARYTPDFIEDNEIAVMKGGHVCTSIRHLPIGDHMVTLEVTRKMFLSVNGHRHIIAIITDISEKEKYQHELELAKEKAEQSDKLKSSFLANMSHEIRTPLNAIVGFSELLADSDELSEKQEYKNIISTNSEYLLRLINDILDLSKIESGILEWRREWFNISDLANELYTIIKPKIKIGEVELLLDMPYANCQVLLDKNRLKQVWINFLTNAAKCTFYGHIKIGYTVEKNGIRIYVEDTGVGIPKENRNKVFTRFEKLNEFAQGTGLGLSICRAIVENTGGEIGFDSTPDVGSTFWAFIPCNPDVQMHFEVDACDQHTQRNTPASNLNILVAEDNDSNYLLVHHILKDYRVTRAINGAEAVDKVQSGAFDLVLMDMRMPVMDGIEATRRIREFNDKIPIVALTANAFDSDRTAALQAGCNQMIVKPLNKSELLEILNKL